jgi:hypothetical protein
MFLICVGLCVSGQTFDVPECARNCGAPEKLRLELVADGTEIANVNSDCVVGGELTTRLQGRGIVGRPQRRGPNTRMPTSPRRNVREAIGEKIYAMCARCGNVSPDTWFENCKKA